MMDGVAVLVFLNVCIDSVDFYRIRCPGGTGLWRAMGLQNGVRMIFGNPEMCPHELIL